MVLYFTVEYGEALTKPAISPLLGIAIVSVQGGLTLAIPLLSAATVGVEGAGFFALLAAAILLIRAIASGGLHGSLLPLIHGSPDAGQRATKIFLSWSRQVSAVALVLALFIVLMIHDAHAPTAAVALLLGAQSGLLLVGQSLWRLRGPRTHIVAASLSIPVLLLLAVVPAAVVGTYAATLFLGGASVGYLLLISIRGRTAPLITPGMLRELKLGVPLVITALATAGLAAADRFIVAWTLGFESVGIYQVVYVTAALGVPMSAGFSQWWSPAVMSDIRNSKARVSETFPSVLVAFSLVNMGAALASPAVAAAIPGWSVHADDSAMLAVWIGAAATAYVFYQAANVLLLAEAQTRALMTGVLVGSLVGLASGAALAQHLGLVGFGIASTVGYVVAAIFCMKAARWSPSGSALLGSSALWCTAIFLFVMVIPSAGYFLIARGVVGALLSFAGLWVAIRQTI